MVGIPEEWGGYLHLRQLHFPSMGLTMPFLRGCLFGNKLPVRTIDADYDIRDLGRGAVGDLGLDVDVTVVAGSDIQGMALEIEVFGGDDNAHGAEKTSTRVPSGVYFAHCVGLYHKDVLMIIQEFGADVYLKPYIAIVCLSDIFSVQEDACDTSLCPLP